LKIVPIEHDPAQARDYLNDKSLQVGHILPVGEGLLGEYFATGSSFVLLKGRAADALFSYNAGRDKQVPTVRFRVVTDSIVGLREATRLVEETAVAGEKMVLRTNVFGYDKKRLQALKALGYTVGASLPGVVSLDGRRFDYQTLAMRLHLGRIWLSVFEGNSPALALYRKTGFEESGKVPGWLQEGYVDEIFMTLKLD